MNKPMVPTGFVVAILYLIVGTKVAFAHYDNFDDNDRRCLRPPPGLTSWWPGDGNTDDIVGGRNAELQENTSFGLALVDQAFLLHGDGDADGSGDFVSVLHDPALDFGTSDFTVDLWAFFNDPGIGEQVLIEKWVQSFSNSSGGWTFTKLDDNAIGFFIESFGGASQGAISDPLPLRAGTWTHFAATRRAGTITLYVNGIRVAREFFAEGNANANSLSSLKFGHRGNPNDTPGSESDQQFYLVGGVDEVEIFVGRALSRIEIQAIFAAGRRGKCKSAL